MGIKEDLKSTPKKISNFFISIWKYFEYILFILLEKVKNIQDFFNDPYITYKKTIYGFQGVISEFTEEDDSDITPEEKIAKKRGEKSGYMPSPSVLMEIRRHIGLCISIVMIIVAWTLNARFRTQYINQITEKENDISASISQSTIYMGINFNDAQTYYYNPKTQSNVNLLLRDYYINSSYKSYLASGTGALPTTQFLKTIINAGARAIHFDVYEDLLENPENNLMADYIPNVRNFNNIVSDGIAFSDIILALVNTDPFSETTIKNSNYPLILYLDFWYQDEDDIGTNKVYKGFRPQSSLSTYNSIYNTLTKYFPLKKYFNLGQTSFGSSGIQSNSGIGNIPYSVVKGKILLISNINTQNPENSNIGELSKLLLDVVNIDLGNKPSIIIQNANNTTEEENSDTPTKKNNELYSPINGQIYSSQLVSMGGIIGEKGGGIQDFVNTTKNSMYIIIPNTSNVINKFMWKKNLSNPMFLDCFNYGCQMVFMYYQDGFSQMANYLQFFKDQSFIVKPSKLRVITPKAPLVPTQTENNSYGSMQALDVPEWANYKL